MEQLTNDQIAELRSQGLSEGEICAVDEACAAAERRHAAAIERRADAARHDRVEAHREALRWDRTHGDER